ncbi:unnamed protein product, partial [Polarella glacialis]
MASLAAKAAEMAAGTTDFHSLVMSCNKDGMEAMRKGQTKAAFEQFKYAEAILLASQAGAGGEIASLQAVTCNNLGCYYKKVGKHHGALSYLRKALQMEIELNADEVTLAGTHLNICAILSKLDKHGKAVQHALAALELVNNRVSTSCPGGVTSEDYSVLAIAYHNVAAERDHLEQYDKAAAAFQQGHQVARRCLGEDHPLAVTLRNNCDAVLRKSQKLTRVDLQGGPPHRMPARDLDLAGFRGGLVEDLGAGGSRTLPPLPGALKNDGQQRSAAQQDALDLAGEESAWSSFARSAIGDGETVVSPTSRGQLSLGTQLVPVRAAEALTEAQQRDLALPMFGRHDIPFHSVPPPPVRLLDKKNNFAQALESFPQNIMDIIQADRTGLKVAVSTRGAPHDHRPNRVIKGSTRTSRVLERTMAFNSTTHRDKVAKSRGEPRTPDSRKMAWIKNTAAERIQRVWRSWYKYCGENAEWMMTTHIAATQIQSRWRSYHVRRQRWDRSATNIQRHARGMLVRRNLRKHRAARTLQRFARGMNARARLLKLYEAAKKIQALVRGGLARKRARRKRHSQTQLAITIQCAHRQHLARRRVQVKRRELQTLKARKAAAVHIQRTFQGGQGRARAADAGVAYQADMLRYKSATKLQSMVRRDHAIRRVDKVRAEKFDQMNRAATKIRKMVLGAQTRRKYKELLYELSRNVGAIITMQRHARGFLVRLRMWRQAIRAEEELWGSLEIQRVWRGYQGRVKWEAKYEQLWSREMAASMINRNVRGWVARNKVNRIRRKIARTEFERARQRFRASQRIQALARGVLVRKVFRQRFVRARHAAVQIQRIARGHALRKRMWQQVKVQRAVKIQAHVRGCLVRRRRMHLIAKVICIQRNWRQWLRKSPEVREKAVEQMRERKKNAT